MAATESGDCLFWKPLLHTCFYSPTQDGAQQLPAGMPLFLSWDFFLHDSQATDTAPAPRPAWGTTVQYVVEAGGLLDEYLSTKTMAVRSITCGCFM